ncbi:tetratricopeptide repeat protein [Streptomyces sp. NBC_01239]|uniref:AfsR/SARP family transcriptional regulator n=1 Tax=unclassified Streptomyces TaxID=2593676 RepID=UPI0022599E74|nr:MULTISPECIES: BTAD domain-containing putative transcriptional regulator [unclassified Streptomyces]MCX4817954.1 tetratricopeptide repeat protein [Streptomyces sp. NBC_01239]
MRFTLLGPVRAWRGSEEVDLGSPQQRTVLVALLLAKGAIVPVDELIDAVWGTAVPSSARGTLRTYIHRLRRTLDSSADVPGSSITSAGNGYQLVVAPADALDIDVFNGLVVRAEHVLRTGDLRQGAELLREALGLWRGPALSGVRGEYADARRRGLDDQRLSAEALLMSTEIELGHPAQTVGRLTGLVSENPLDERFRELLMRALYRSGRQAAALATYRDIQELLARELGVDPGPDLQVMFQRVLRADAGLAAPSASTHAGAVTARAEPVEVRPRATADVGSVPPAQLPAGLAVFVGRESELAMAARLVRDCDSVIAVVTGMAGIGKTSFAVRWARQSADDFPDGQIYLNLRGFDHASPPLTPGQAIGMALDALGASPGNVPQDTDARASYYRTWLSGKRVLLLLDNARDAAQVRPLLPGAPGCRVIVTSRDQMAGLVAVDSAQPIQLGVLSDAESRGLLARRLGKDRTEAEPTATAEIVGLCRRLPLALAVVAGRAATRPALPLSAIVAELRESAGGLDAFRSGDTAADVRAVFSYSYHALDADAARLFRLLSLHPGPDAELGSVASLVGLPLARTRRLLDELLRAHLADQLSSGRYSCHDLLAAYASELLQEEDTEEERASARRRMLDHYLHSATIARRYLSSVPTPASVDIPAAAPGVHITEFDGERTTATAAREWFDAEHSVLLACVELAAATRLDTYTWCLAWALGPYLERRSKWTEVKTAFHQAREAAERLGDLFAEGYAHGALAQASVTTDSMEEASAHMARALLLFAALGDPVLLGKAHSQASWVVERAGDLEAALDHSRQALDLHRSAGAGNVTTGRILNSVGWYRARLGQYEQALDHCREALPLLKEGGDVMGFADTLLSIGYVHRMTGAYASAASLYEEAIPHLRATGATFNAAVALDELGDIHLSLGRHEDALKAWHEAAEGLNALGHAKADAIWAKIGRTAATPTAHLRAVTDE